MTAVPPADPEVYLPVRPDWLAQLHEPAIDPGRPIVDCHHHLWDRPNWRYLAADFAADLASGHNVVATVHVQGRASYRTTGPEALRPVGETVFAAAVAEKAAGQEGVALCAGIVSFADLTLGAAVRPVLKAHAAAGGGRFRGVRQITAWTDDPALRGSSSAPGPGMLADPAFRAGFAELAPLGLSFDAWLYHPQIDELTDLARAFPDTSIVLDHFGSPVGIGVWAGRGGDVFKCWARAIRRLSACGNVSIKLGGLGMRLTGMGFERTPAPPGSDDLAKACQPWFDVAVDAFGAARCMFEANFPVDKGSYGYGVFWNACKRMSAHLSEEKLHDLFAGTATRVYDLHSALR